MFNINLIEIIDVHIWLFRPKKSPLSHYSRFGASAHETVLESLYSAAVNNIVPHFRNRAICNDVQDVQNYDDYQVRLCSEYFVG